MKFGKTLLALIGRQPAKPEPPDAFALRLARMQMREGRRKVRQALFRTPSPPLAA